MNIRTKRLLIAVLLILIALGCSGEEKRASKPTCEDQTAITRIQVTPVQPADADTLQAIAEVLRKRATRAFGPVAVCPQDRGFEVRLDQQVDKVRGATLLGRRGRLEFRPVHNELRSDSSEWRRTPSCANQPETLPEKSGGKLFCVTMLNPGGVALSGGQWPKLELGSPVLGNGDVVSADALLEAQFDNWQVSLRFTPPGGERFAAITGALACEPAGSLTRQLAIVVDGIVLSHPQMGEDVTCREGIRGNTASIGGSFSEQFAKDLASILSGGALPTAVDVH